MKLRLIRTRSALLRHEGVGFATSSSPGQATMYSRTDLRSTYRPGMISDSIFGKGMSTTRVIDHNECPIVRRYMGYAHSSLSDIYEPANTRRLTI